MNSSRRRHSRAAPVVLFGLLAGCSSPSAQPATSPHQQPAGAVNPITVDSTETQIRQAVGTARVGRKLTPKTWPDGARVAVCLSFDVDNELLQRANPLPVPLSVGEYGATTAVPRILDLLDRHQVPATFFIPAMSAMLAADEPYEIVSNGQPSGVIELPIAEVSNDYVYYGETADGAMPSPDAV